MPLAPRRAIVIGSEPLARGPWGWLGPLALYGLISLALFGGSVLGHFGSRIIAADQIDSSQFMWFFAWWPHAIVHGLNPFISHAMFAPEGVNLTWSAAMPGPSILLAPVTLTAGPVVSWNLIELAAPALSAWTAFLLCRHVTGRVGPSLVGGYVFGFSPYMLLNLTGAPNLAFTALLPVLVWLVLLRIARRISPRWFVLATAVALAGQFSVSTEVLATATLFGAVALVLAAALEPAVRPALRETAGLLVLAYVAAAVLVSPFLYFFISGQHYPAGATNFNADVAAYVLPSPRMAITRHSPAFAGADTQPYLGLPLIALLVACAWRGGRRRIAWLPVLVLVAAGLCSLGSHVVVGGHRTAVPGPWWVLGRLPFLHYAIPVRLALYVALAGAVMTAMFLSGEPAAATADRGTRFAGAWRWGLALLAVVFILPDVGNAAWDTPVRDPAFFAHGTYRRYVTSSDRVLTIPAWGPNARWQADTKFGFTLVGGYRGNPFPSSYTRYPIWNAFLTGQLPADYAAQLRRFIRAKGVTAVIVDATAGGPWSRLFGTLGVRPISVGGVVLYRLRGTSPTPT
jgi:hypothetical protein